MFQENKNESQKSEKEFIDELETVDDLIWLLHNSPYFRNAIMGFAVKFFYDNSILIKRNIKKFRAKKEGKE